MLDLEHKPIAVASRGTFDGKQPRRLLLALVLLLVALAGVLIRDRQFWFGNGELEDADASVPEATHQTVAKSAPSSVPAAKRLSIPAGKKQIQTAQPAETPAVATTRTVLPPLDVEVVAGDNHRKVHPGSNASRLEISNAASAAEMDSTAAATNAAERESLAASIPADPAYPLLAQHMKVQGSVVLQAVIGADGIIENLRVLSGPGILTTAAQQAVREWRFKPIIQNGQAVESKARITVNFSINVADGTTKTTLAESRADDIRILSR